MASVTTPKSERSQILTAVLFMSIFVATVVLIILVKDNMASFACQYKLFENICTNLLSSSIHSEEFTTSQINSACVDTQGLKISVAFGAPLKGEASIQIFTTGEDVFPSEQGMADSFKMSMAIPDITDQLEFVIPVESMPVGEQIFGNIVTIREKVVSSHVAYFVKVSDCSITKTPISNPTLMTNLDNIPINYNATCLPGKRLMVAFEFDRPVQGQYRALIAGIPYQLASVGNQPAILFFSGALPQSEPVLMRLVSATDQAVVFEESYTPPACSVNE